MGDMADDAMFEASKYDAFQDQQHWLADVLLEEYKMGIAEWKTVEGYKILVRNMGNNHINNVIKYLERKKSTPMNDMWIKILSAEQLKRTNLRTT